MIVWLNGAYGVGKSTTAEALHKRIADSFIFDPEMIGNCVSVNVNEKVSRALMKF